MAASVPLDAAFASAQAEAANHTPKRPRAVAFASPQSPPGRQSPRRPPPRNPKTDLPPPAVHVVPFPRVVSSEITSALSEKEYQAACREICEWMGRNMYPDRVLLREKLVLPHLVKPTLATDTEECLEATVRICEEVGRVLQQLMTRYPSCNQYRNPPRAADWGRLEQKLALFRDHEKKSEHEKSTRAYRLDRASAAIYISLLADELSFDFRHCIEPQQSLLYELMSVAGARNFVHFLEDASLEVLASRAPMSLLPYLLKMLCMSIRVLDAVVMDLAPADAYLRLCPQLRPPVGGDVATAALALGLMPEPEVKLKLLECILQKDFVNTGTCSWLGTPMGVGKLRLYCGLPRAPQRNQAYQALVTCELLLTAHLSKPNENWLSEMRSSFDAFLAKLAPKAVEQLELRCRINLLKILMGPPAAAAPPGTGESPAKTPGRGARL